MKIREQHMGLVGVRVRVGVRVGVRVRVGGRNICSVFYRYVACAVGDDIVVRRVHDAALISPVRPQTR